MDISPDARAAGTSCAEAAPATPEQARRGPFALIWRTLVKAWDDGIFGMSAQAAFWMTLSLPPLLLGLLGSLGFVSKLFGRDAIDLVQREILQLAATVFTPTVVDQIIRPTVTDILTKGHSSLVSVGFVLSLWAGSSALASLVDSITAAYHQHNVRNPVWQRTFALLLYVVLLMGSVFVLPLVALGPGVLPDLFPTSTRPTVAHLVGVFYYPVLAALLALGLATLYKIVLPNKLPWHRGLPGALLAMVVFLVSSETLRRYIAWVTGTGYTYGALATPIAYLLFSFFIAMALVLGADFNFVIEDMWPAHATRRERRRGRRLGMARLAERTRQDSAQRPESESGPPTRDTTGRHTRPFDAPSPADTTGTVELPRNGQRDTGLREATNTNTASDPPGPGPDH
ncbi:MAG TPA: YihY/virulence factor BrkB family protein [Pseudonocardiaceae bacterium]|jgi:membrane protein